MKDKLGVDPQNTTWAKDNGRFGYRMLLGMGWSEGKGLGVNEDGIKQTVKVTKRDTNLGLGADVNTSNNWLANSDAFSGILSRLNSSESIEKPNVSSSTANKTNSIRTNRRIRYHKLVKAKTLANHSTADLSTILVSSQSVGNEDRDTDSMPSPVLESKKRKQDAITKNQKTHHESSSDESASESDEADTDNSSSDDSASDSDRPSSGESSSDESSSSSDSSSDEESTYTKKNINKQKSKKIKTSKL